MKTGAKDLTIDLAYGRAADQNMVSYSNLCLSNSIALGCGTHYSYLYGPKESQTLGTKMDLGGNEDS